MNKDAALHYLESLGKFGSQPGLDRIAKLLDLMNHPERAYKTIHITGTNGKGSTTAFIASILQAAGIRTAMFTSPHLLDYYERFVVDGRQITQEAFAQSIAYTKQFVDQMVADGHDHPTEFEVLTAAAFYYFAISQVEYAVIEVGLGGLLDSTNVITPVLSVITNISLEHTDRCGTTVAEIAAHKAGIIKPHVPVVTAAKSEALNVIYNQADQLHAPLFVMERDFFVQWKGEKSGQQIITVRSNQYGNLTNLQTVLLGQHQSDNCACAVMAAQVLSQQDERISGDSIRQGVARTVWPGRFEILATSPTVIVDGAHNPAGTEALRSTLDEHYGKQPITFIFGALADKNLLAMAENLFYPDDRVVTVAPSSERAADPVALMKVIAAAKVKAAASFDEAIEVAYHLTEEDGIICVCGSIYLIGKIREMVMHRQTDKPHV